MTHSLTACQIMVEELSKSFQKEFPHLSGDDRKRIIDRLHNVVLARLEIRERGARDA